MTTITKQKIRKLSEARSTPSITIYLPTSQYGEKVLKEEDVLSLKNQLKDIRIKLKKQHYKTHEVDEIMQPLDDLLEDKTFWKYQSEGLAIFLSKSHFRKYHLPLSFSTFNSVANEFYLEPLLPLFASDPRFFILTLALHDVKFYERTIYGISEVIIEDLTPSRLEESVCFDYEQKSLQFKSQKQGMVTFHGHGEGKEDEKEEVLTYLRAVNKGLVKMLNDETSPMIVACLDYMFPLYKQANTYQHLVSQHISCHPSDLDLSELHEAAWKIMKPHFNKVRDEKLALLEQYNDTSRASSKVREIIPAAIDGKVDTLFLEEGINYWGIYNPKNYTVKIESEHQPPNVSLTNLVAIQVFLQGGNVYIMGKGELPAKVCALYRY